MLWEIFEQSRKFVILKMDLKTYLDKNSKIIFFVYLLKQMQKLISLSLENYVQYITYQHY